MFGKSRATATASVPNVPSRPSTKQVVVGTQSLGVYEELAGKLNYLPAQLLEEQLLRLLAENNIRVFDHDEVDRYLAAIAEAEGKMWIWRPLRDEDRPDWGEGGAGESNHHGWWGRTPKGSNEYVGHGSCRPKEHAYRPYHRAVPVHVLRKVDLIQNKFGPRVKFFVSDYAVPKPDPFIMVTARDVSHIIFDVWDEPGFGNS